MRTIEERTASRFTVEKTTPNPPKQTVMNRGPSAVPRPDAVMRTSTPQEGESGIKSPVDVPNEAISSSLPVKKVSGRHVPSGANKSAKSLPAYPDGLSRVGMLLETNAPDGVAVPTNRSSKERCQARDAMASARDQDGPGLKSGSSRAPQDSAVQWQGPHARRTQARSASRSLADATEGELQAVSDEDDEEADDDEGDSDEDEGSVMKRSGSKPTRPPTSGDELKKPSPPQEEEVPQPMPSGEHCAF